MSNKNMSHNRSNKWNVQLPTRYNDHVMSNVSQNRMNSEQNKKNNEVRVNFAENDKESNDRMMNKLGDEANKLGNLNIRYADINGINANKPVDNGYEVLSSDKEGLESDKECLEDVSQVDKQNELSSKNIDKARLNVNDENRTKNREEVMVFDEEMVKIGSKKFGYKEIIDNGNGSWLFKFTMEDRLNEVAAKSPWMVHGKPLMVYKWDPGIGLDKVEPKVILVWVKLHNMPIEAWTNNGISAIASCLGKLKIMDSMKTYVCKSGMGRIKFARVLVEIKVVKGLKEEIELQYMDKDQAVKGTKKIKVEYDRKPPICNHCNVFGHSFDKCSKRTKTMEEIAIETEENNKKNEGDKGKDNSNIEKSFEAELTPLRVELQAINKGKVVKNSNRFSVLRGINDDIQQELNMLKDKMIVDKYLNLKLQPNNDEIKDWSQEMIKYFKRAWDANREKEENKRMYEMKVLYAANSGMERRELWNELHVAKLSTNGVPWTLMGDFNVTLNVGGHSFSRSSVDGDMEDFIDCVNNIEVADMCKTEMHFTWIKSPKKHCTSVMKKLDRIMANEDFVAEYNQAYDVFHPFLVSDHSLAVLILPQGMEKKGSHLSLLTLLLIKRTFWLLLKTAQLEVNEDPFNAAKKAIASKIMDKYNVAVNDKNKVGIIMEGDKVATEFVSHFENFLGQASQVSKDDGNDGVEVFVESVKVIKASLDKYSNVTWLKPNMSKSTIFFGNVDIGERNIILDIIPFQIGTFPMRYLRVPLITKILGKDECKQLVDKVKQKVGDWKNKFISYAGRVQLIASVLGSMQVYWAYVFLLSMSVVKDIEKVLNGFL
ncbi:RNA-directed DNA polymerase, eukaryota, reverse transcriptase zinc-binding domain protein [Tanacetum coccineum]|uniref:RNA-directed DNA polymerase, eukaryota, reverse transcriptase zinc-binding domain protein n=1 Tax=Tanacetum coccineum TaxID=301880 RepID=A0ABQ5IF11_9ASTR